MKVEVLAPSFPPHLQVLSFVQHKQSNPTVCYRQVTQGHTALQHVWIDYKINRNTLAPMFSQENLWDRNISKWCGKKTSARQNSQIILETLCFFATMEEMFEFPSDISNRQKMLPSCQLIFVQMHDAGGQIHGCGSSTMLWSQLSLQGACVWEAALSKASYCSATNMPA